MSLLQTQLPRVSASKGGKGGQGNARELGEYQDTIREAIIRVESVAKLIKRIDWKDRKSLSSDIGQDYRALKKEFRSTL